MFSSFLLALTIAFPKSGQTLPPVERTYMSGSVPHGITNIVVQGKDVPVYWTGGWVTMVDLVEGTNLIEVVSVSTRTNYTIRVARRASGSSGAAAEPKKYAKLSYAKDEARKHPAGKKPADCVIVLDPGHGGANDCGAISPHGYHEKDANLSFARILRNVLVKRGYRVAMTRDDDTAIHRLERGRIACTNENAVAFISIHHNAPNYNRDPRGLRYMCVYAWNAIGKALAKPICDRMGAVLEGDIPNNGVLEANYAVTRNPEVPSCLLEIDFITTPEGEAAIWNTPRRFKIANAIADGIDDWLLAPYLKTQNML